jgi:hypothetical protein
MATDRAVAAAQSPRCAAGRRPRRDQWNHADVAVGRALARLSARLRPLHDDLQSLQPLEPAGIWLDMSKTLTGRAALFGTAAERRLTCPGSPHREAGTAGDRSSPL